MSSTSSPLIRGLKIFQSQKVADAYMALNQGLHGVLDAKNSTPEMQFQKAVESNKQKQALKIQLNNGPTLPIPDEFKPKLR